MAKRVSADTITEITTSPGFHDAAGAASPPPTSEQLIDALRKDLAAKAAFALKALSAVNPADEQALQDARKAAARTATSVTKLESMLKEVPKGFRLVPVLYSRITQEENAVLKNEYSFTVRPRFLKFLGEKHADELKALGICDTGIERMKNGLDPTNEQGEHYSVNIDHIVERAGSGLWGKTRDYDPDAPGTKPQLHPNHYGNFILLPEKIHEFKNTLNDMQDASDTTPGKSKWILMMAPERDALHSGFVCQPQDPTHRLAGLDLRAVDDFKKTEHGEFIVRGTLNELAQLKEMGNFRQIVRGQIAEAEKLDTTVADLAAAQEASKPPSLLRKAFADAVAKSPEANAQLNNLVKPAIKDVTTYVAKLFNTLQSKTGTSKERAAFWKFARFFRSQEVRDLQADVEALPFAEASELNKSFVQLAKDITKVCDRLDGEAKAKFAKDNANGVPDFRQDNTPPKGQPLQKPFRKQKNQPKDGESRSKRTFGRPGHFKNGSGH